MNKAHIRMQGTSRHPHVSKCIVVQSGLAVKMTKANEKTDCDALM